MASVEFQIREIMIKVAESQLREQLEKEEKARSEAAVAKLMEIHMRKALSQAAESAQIPIAWPGFKS